VVSCHPLLDHCFIIWKKERAVHCNTLRTFTTVTKVLPLTQRYVAPQVVQFQGLEVFQAIIIAGFTAEAHSGIITTARHVTVFSPYGLSAETIDTHLDATIAMSPSLASSLLLFYKSLPRYSVETKQNKTNKQTTYRFSANGSHQV
jgi:hypothetical protein